MHTTIAISLSVRDQLKEFGNKGETYDEILERLIRSAKDRQMQEILMDERGTIPIEVAVARAKKQWPR